MPTHYCQPSHYHRLLLDTDCPLSPSTYPPSPNKWRNQTKWQYNLKGMNMRVKISLYDHDLYCSSVKCLCLGLRFVNFASYGDFLFHFNFQFLTSKYVFFLIMASLLQFLKSVEFYFVISLILLLLNDHFIKYRALFCQPIVTIGFLF